mgnify:CR=1 FL=1
MLIWAYEFGSSERKWCRNVLYVEKTFGKNRLENGKFIPSNEAGFGIKLLKG